MEANDIGITGSSPSNVALADGTHSLVDHVDLNLGSRELDERVAQCLDRTVNITLDDDIEFVELTQCTQAANVLESAAMLSALHLLALQLLAAVGDLACFLVGVHHVELVTGSRSTVQTKYQGWRRWSSLLDALVALVEHSLYLTVVSTGEHNVTHSQRAVINEHCGNVATSLVERRLND